MPIKRKQTSKPDQVSAVSYVDCPAKSFADDRGKTRPGRSVFNHCQIVGEVAKALIARIPVEAVRNLFPEGSAFVAASHDIGKVSPTFYNKIMNACERTQISGYSPSLERQWGGHAAVSQLTAKELGAPEFTPEILGQHHGFSPNVSALRASDENFGGEPWQTERKKLVEALQDTFGESWPKVASAAQARLLAGLTSVADWIGSGQHFENPDAPWQGNIEKALDDAGFIPASYQPKLSFEEVFSFPPRPAQAALIEQVTTPGVYVLEAPMGLGKTEAALYAAYLMLANQQASGIYFALPTQLTSNKIFERFQEFLDKILADDCQHRSLLLHANAWLFETDMGEEGRPGGAWFKHAKRGLLAPFAVGTIDQALMAAMNVKHGFVRAFGLAGKVVILDEVHTYDAYTGTLLDAVVSLLRALNCTVIILSATLSQERRQQLLGRRTESMDYPLITACPGDDAERAIEAPVSMGESRSLQVSIGNDDAIAVEHALIRAEQGQQVLWIENTVKEAQQRYLDLAARATDLGVACGLLHSRFTVDDRQCLEEQWVNFYGKNGWQNRHLQGRILVGTQVLEQSLDIDADFMVSRFAPTDMLLQRLGRLWRHDETPRCAAAEPDVWLLAPELNAAIESPHTQFGASAYVYNPYVLCRSLELWQGVRSISLPSDIRQLIERTYANRDEQGAMQRWLRELKEGTSRRTGELAMRQLARVALAQGGNTLPESKADTRYSEADNFDVLLLRSLSHSRDGLTALITLLNGERIQLPTKHRYRLTKPQWRALTGVLMRQVVSVRRSESPKPVPTETLRRFGLHHCFYLGNPDWPEDESVLRVALLTETDELKGIEHTDIHDKLTLEYRNDLGYRVIKD